MYSKFNWSRKPCRALIHCRWRLLPGSSPSGPESETNRDWRGATHPTCSRRTTTKSLARLDSMTSRSRGGMRRFSRTIDAATVLWDPAEHRKRGPPPRRYNVIECGKVGKGRSRVYRREWLLSQNQSIHRARLHSGMESWEGEGEEGWRGEAER